MKLSGILPKLILTTAAAVGLLAVSFSAHAGLAIPYTANADTLHLWHLNETNGSLYAYDSADIDLQTNSFPITLTNIGEVSFPFTNTSFGSPGPGFPGLTNAYTGNNKFHLLYGGNYTDVDGLLCNPTTRAFTFEALVMMTNTLAGDFEIFTGDNGLGIANRGWQWRFNTSEEQWDLLAGNTDNNFVPVLPTTGVDTAKLNTWYHVAVTFTGNSPTNGDTPSELKLYWTLLDPSRTFADVLYTQENITNATASPNNPGPYGVRPLDGSPEGVSEPNIAIGGSGRATTGNIGNNEGFIGSIAEVRVSDLCLKSNEMAFSSGGVFPPTNNSPLPSSLLVGYGQPLSITADVSASQPASYFWYQNSSLLPNQTSATLSIPSVNFTDTGSYYLVTTNAYGSATSSVVQITVGANADELYGTGIISNQVSSGDVIDPNYFLIQSGNPSFLGPNEFIWESNCPIEIICSTGGYAPGVADSMWISDQGNEGGNAPGDPAGTYTIRTYFLLDSTSPTNLFYQSGLECDGYITNIVLNGQSTGFSFKPGAPLYSQNITLSNYNGLLTFTAQGSTLTSPLFFQSENPNFFVPGLNTMDFVMIENGIAALKVDAPTMVGYALPPGVPTILQQPAPETVRDANITGVGTDAKFSVVAVGRPPLTYQWYTNGFLLPAGTTRTLNYSNAAAGLQGTNFYVVVSNDSGSVTSRVASLTLVPTNQPPIAPNHTFYVYENQTLDIDLSTLFNESSDPDGDTLTLAAYDTATTNGVGLNFVTSTLVSYTPNQNYLGSDSFTYTIQDSLGASTVGTNFIHVIAPVLPTVIAPTLSSGNVAFSGTGGTPGGVYNILGSSDLSVPLSSWSVATSGNFDSQGNFSVSLPIIPGAPHMFYVLALPLPND